ncbi:methyl-accepting chemotaxis protein [uncultured Brachyspira sp.]|uniref:methyl-accepting chemotaxis protein n=1 Tax=uncultured Brachyspira sp. TaxID=221953 RepID=UPI00260A8B3F|nr:methyl-accepting chemotaxis protein [uncultured Brachyspira sp.]
MSKFNSLQFKISMIILVPFFIMLMISGAFNILSVRNVTRKLSYRVLEESAKGEAAKVENLVQEALDSLKTFEYIVNDLYSSGERNRDIYKENVEEFFSTLPEGTGALFLVFEPNMMGNDADYINDANYSEAGGMFSEYAYRNNGSISSRGMTKEELKSDYYTAPIKSGNTHITSIYDFEVGGKMVKMNTWSIPIKNNNKVIGVAGVDIFIDSLAPIMDNIKPFENTLTSLFDHNGSLLYNVEDESYIGQNVYDAYSYYKDYNLLDKIKAGETIIFEEYSSTLKTKSTYIFVPIKLQTGQNWGMKILVPNYIILKDSTNIRNIMIIVSIVMLLTVFIITPLIIRNKVIIIIKLLAQDLTRLSNGDISWSTPPGFVALKDEWGTIARAVQGILDNLNNVMETVKQSSSQVENAANEVLSGNQDLSNRTEMQASSLEETASTMSEMASNVKYVTKDISDTTVIVVEAKEYVSKAGEIIEDSVNKMDAVYEASSKIMDITKLIESIAFQTNILALNASVEAARAGEQGRGFAVVASEVRNLAQNTQESVKNITSLIIDSNDKINLAAASVNESKEMFIEISEIMDKASDLMQKIDMSSKEQERGIEQINTAITNMDSSVQQNAALVEEASSSSQLLLNESQNLSKLIDFFKLR